MPPHQITRVFAGRLFAVLLAGFGLAPATTCAAGAPDEPAGAEFAIRWNPHDGGPRTGEEALAVLNLRAKRPSHVTVEYFELSSTTLAPSGFTPILRRRIDAAGRQEMTFKLRGDHALAQWTCPLANPVKSKVELDVTFGAAKSTTRAYSYSCSGEGEQAAPSLAARPKGCPANVKRWERGDVKVEAWGLAGGAALIEVSIVGANTTAAAEQFRRRVAEPLLAAGIVPSADSKTALGGGC